MLLDAGSFQLECLAWMGFGHFLSILEFPLRPMFLEEVAEQYNYQTSSIVTRVGEFVLSLEDMVRLTGLRVTGRSVTGRVRLDYTVIMRDLVGSRIVMHGPHLLVISSAVHQIEDSFEMVTGPGVDADQQLRALTGPGVDADQQLQAFLLVLFEEVLFSHATSKLSTIFLPLLADLDQVEEYAWGAASLTHLYSTLFHFTDNNSRQLGGNLPFLQVNVVLAC